MPSLYHHRARRKPVAFTCGFIPCFSPFFLAKEEESEKQYLALTPTPLVALCSRNQQLTLHPLHIYFIFRQ
jgi:hypothetical protein